jgi:HK97 family phage prohead protease
MHAPLTPPSRLELHADGTIEGYASLFGAVDQARDMVMPGAFTQTLKQRGLRKIPMLFQHDPAEPVGVWLDLAEDFRGLRARGKLIPDVARGRELLALLKAGAIDGLSIGYRTVRGSIDPKTRVRKLYQVDLWEISIVTFPLLAGARVNAVKDAPKQSRQREAAERQWQGLSGAADAPAPLTRRGGIAHLSLRSRADRKRALDGLILRRA